MSTERIKENFTRVPNLYFDLIIGKEINLNEARILSFMIRHTFGWGKDGFSMVFTFRDLDEYLSINIKNGYKTIKSLIEKNLIEKAEIEGKMHYRLVQKLALTDWGRNVDWKKQIKGPYCKTIGGSSVGELPTKEDDGILPTEDRQYTNKTVGDLPVSQDQKSLIESRKSASLNKGLNKNDKQRDDDIRKQLVENVYMEFKRFLDSSDYDEVVKRVDRVYAEGDINDYEAYLRKAVFAEINNRTRKKEKHGANKVKELSLGRKGRHKRPVIPIARRVESQRNFEETDNSKYQLTEKQQELVDRINSLNNVNNKNSAPHFR